MDRRNFLINTGLGSAAFITGLLNANSIPATNLNQKLPCWHGFNLIEKQDVSKTGKYTPYLESDFEKIAELGFNLVRLPIDCNCFIDDHNPTRFDDQALQQIDQALNWGKQYKIHVSLNMYEAPGYRLGKEIVPNLWLDNYTLQLFIHYWKHFAERYKNLPAENLSFHLINEPGQIFPVSDPKKRITVEMYEKVVRHTVNEILNIDPERLIIVDGLNWANEPVIEFIDLPISQSTHWFIPSGIALFHSPWLPEKKREKQVQPTSWPYQKDDVIYDKEWLYKTKVSKWEELSKLGVGVQISAWGIVDTVPHEVALNWMRDSLELFKEQNWGWALWNFKGEDGFGFLDTNRKDVKYENYKGHKLDRKMLELLLNY